MHSQKDVTKKQRKQNNKQKGAFTRNTVQEEEAPTRKPTPEARRACLALSSLLPQSKSNSGPSTVF